MKNFLDFNGARVFFSKLFRYVKVFDEIYVHEHQMRAQFLPDTKFMELYPTRLYYGFRVKLMVFMALTNCFRKNFMDFLSFALISYTFCSPMT